MLKRNLFFLFSLLVIFLASSVLCIFNYNPYQASLNQMMISYTCFAMLLMCIFSLIIFYLKIYISKKECIYLFFWPSVRQATILSIGISTLFILKGMKLLDMWSGIPIFISIILLEMFFQTKRKAPSA